MYDRICLGGTRLGWGYNQHEVVIVKSFGNIIGGTLLAFKDWETLNSAIL